MNENTGKCIMLLPVQVQVKVYIATTILKLCWSLISRRSSGKTPAHQSVHACMYVCTMLVFTNKQHKGKCSFPHFFRFSIRVFITL